MKIKLDENMPVALVDLLRQAQHDVRTVTDEGLGGLDDSGVMNAATHEDRVLLTFDLDFGNIYDFPLGSHAGVVVFRLHDQRWQNLEEPARRVMESGVLDRLQRGLAVVDEAGIRFRRGL